MLLSFGLHAGGEIYLYFELKSFASNDWRHVLTTHVQLQVSDGITHGVPTCEIPRAPPRTKVQSRHFQLQPPSLSYCIN